MLPPLLIRRRAIGAPHLLLRVGGEPSSLEGEGVMTPELATLVLEVVKIGFLLVALVVIDLRV
jgi:hypothetical protein